MEIEGVFEDKIISIKAFYLKNSQVLEIRVPFVGSLPNFFFFFYKTVYTIMSAFNQCFSSVQSACAEDLSLDKQILYPG